MAEWTNEELETIDDRDELRIGTRRSDGLLRRPVIVWMVRHADDVYVRSVKGRDASWFHGAQTRHKAHVSVAGLEREVILVEVDERNDELDAAYEKKYGRRYASIVPSIVAPDARAATLELVPNAGEEES